MPITDREVMIALKADHSFSDVQAFMRRMYADRQFRPTQRDEMAKAALTGMLAANMYDAIGSSQCALEAYEIADAMLVVRGGRAAETTPDLIAALLGLLLPTEFVHPNCEEVIAARAALAKVGVQ